MRKLKFPIFYLIVLTLGLFVGVLVAKNYVLPKLSGENVTPINILLPKKEVIGFLPYWLISKADTDYSKYITTLTYFSLTVGSDGKIQKYTDPGESEPGYLALKNGKFNPFLTSAKEKGENLSIAVFNGDDNDINELLKDPVTSANNLTGDVIPIMQQYGFSDLNLDIEQASDASPEARLKFAEFVQAVKDNINSAKAGTLSIDASAISFVKDTNLFDPEKISKIVDKVILMAYDFHSTISYVTGPVAPAYGAGTVSEFDTDSAIAAALKIMPSQKLILGIPLYGYEWETIGDTARSAVIPGTSLIMSNQRAEDFASGCATCSAVFDATDEEEHLIYKTDTGTYQQIFYPTEVSTQIKVNLAREYSLSGLAVWALGYEGNSILEPLSLYHN